MALSEQEQRALREIERSLMADDPKFGASYAASERSFASGSGGVGFNLRGIALVVVGLLIVICGVMLAQQSLWFVALSVAGFLVMFAATIWMMRDSSSTSAAGSLTKTPQKPQKVKAKSQRSANIEESFRRRFEN